MSAGYNTTRAYAISDAVCRMRGIFLKYIFVAVVCISLLAGVSVWHRSKTEHVIAFFATALTNANISEHVTINGFHYVVTGGSVIGADGYVEGRTREIALRLAYEKAAARYSPRIALPGIDIGMLRSTTDELSQLAVTLALRQRNSLTEDMVRRDLYPTGFLTAVAHAEETRRSFLLSGSEVDARAYEQTQMNALQSFTLDSNAFARAFSVIVPGDIPEYATERTIVERPDILAAITKLQMSMEETGADVRRRIACVRGATQQCDTGDITLPPLPQASGPTIHIEDLALSKDVHSILTEAGAQFSDDHYYVLEKSACISLLSRGAPLFSFTYDTLDNGTIASSSSPVFVGDIHFIDSNVHVMVPFYRYFAEKSVRLVNLSPTTYYQCMQSDVDLGELYILRDVTSFASRENLSRYAAGSDKVVLEHFERKASSPSIISLSDIVPYMYAAEHSAIPAETRDALVALHLRISYASDGLYATMRDVVRRGRVDIRLADQESVPKEFDAEYLFFTRSAFSALFMGSNLSASGMHDPLFQTNTLPLSSQPYVFYSSLPKTALMRQHVIADETFFRALFKTM